MPVYKQKNGYWGFRTQIKKEDGTWKNIRRRGTKNKWNKADATKALAQFSIEQDVGIQTSHLTFDQVASEYMLYLKHKVSHATTKSKFPIIEKYLLSYFKNKKINNINPKHILKWKNEFTNYNFKSSYNNKILACLSSIFTFAMKFYGLPRNPCSVTGYFKCTENKKINFWTKEEYDIFKSSIEDLKWIMIFDTLYFSGIRRGELIGLKWSDIDIKNNQIHINKTLTSTQNGLDVVQKTKTKSSNRTITMPEFWFNNLNIYKNKILKLYRTDISNFYLFGDLKTLCRKKLFVTFKKYIKQAKIKNIRLHDLRHSHASLMINSGINPTVISNRLGHSNTAMTLNIYSHMYPSSDIYAANIINTIENNGRKMDRNQFKNTL